MMRLDPRFCCILTGLLLMTLALAGCVDNGDGDDEETPTVVNAPEWSIGQWWDYYYSIPEEQNVGFKLIVASNDGTNYWVGVEDRNTAYYHAVLNFNPVLGRVSLDEFEIYEKGEPQRILDFPLKAGKQWSFSLLNIDNFDARVTKIENVDLPLSGKTTLAYIEATGSGAEKLSYIYDTSAGWLRSFNLTAANGDPMVQIYLQPDYGKGYTGDVFFVRGKDLFDESYESTASNPELDADADSGENSASGYQFYIHYLQYATQDSSHGSISFQDDEGDGAYIETFGSNEANQILGTTPVVSGDWSLSVELDGTAWLHFRVAAGILYSWELT